MPGVYVDLPFTDGTVFTINPQNPDVEALLRLLHQSQHGEAKALKLMHLLFFIPRRRPILGLFQTNLWTC
jgi:hypothetical protein